MIGNPAEHSKHKIGGRAPSSQDLKQRGDPVEGPSIIYEVACRLNGPCERDRSTGKSLFEKGLIFCSVLNHGIGHASHFGRDRG